MPVASHNNVPIPTVVPHSSWDSLIFVKQPPLLGQRLGLRVVASNGWPSLLEAQTR